MGPDFPYNEPMWTAWRAAASTGLCHAFVWGHDDRQYLCVCTQPEDKMIWAG